MKLWIDDVRLPPTDWEWAKTSKDAILKMSDGVVYDTISFDHDLGGEDSGARVLNWMATELPSHHWPTKIMIHSMNPVGARNLYFLATQYAPGGTIVQRVSVR